MTIRVVPDLTIDEIVSMVSDYEPWFRRKMMQHGWLNSSWAYEDLQQAFLLHCVKYEVAGRYDSAFGASKKTYVFGAMMQFVNAKFCVKFSARKYKPKDKCVIPVSVYCADDDDSPNPFDRADDSVDSGERMMARECLDKLRRGLIERGDIVKIRLLVDCLAANCDWKAVANSRKTRSWIVRRALRRLANTPIGRTICQEFLGNA